MTNPLETRERMRETFLKALAATGRIDKSCEASGLNSTEVYERRKTDKVFAARWQEALEVSYYLLMDEAWRRGVEGVRKPLYHAGEPVYVHRTVIDPDTGLPARDKDGNVVREVLRDAQGQPVQAFEYVYSDAMLSHLLKANIAKFRDRTELTGLDGGPISLEMTDTERARRVAFVLARGLHAKQQAAQNPEPEPATLPEDDYGSMI